MSVEWHGPEASAHVRGRAVQFLTRAALWVVRRAKELLSVSGTGGSKGKGRVYGSNPSKPGEPPHKQHGRLRASVTHEIDEAALTARVGTNVEYGRHLELGAPKAGIAPRPWLRRALDEVRSKVNELLAQIGGD